MITIPMMLAAHVRKVLTENGYSNEITFETEQLYLMTNVLDVLSTTEDSPKFSNEKWGKIHKVTVLSNKKKVIPDEVMTKLFHLIKKYGWKEGTENLSGQDIIRYGYPFEISAVTIQDWEEKLKKHLKNLDTW